MASPLKINVGGHSLAYQTFGEGSPTVVFECGGGDDSESLAGLAREVQHFARAVIYDRAGLGQSDPAPAQPRTIQDAANDLRMLLQTANIPGPYVLVGHSFGGLIVRLFAAQRPDEVAGLVLLDVPPPDQSLRELRILPAPSPGEATAISRMRKAATAEWSDPSTNDEGFDRAASAAQLQATGRLGAIPLVVITAGVDEWDEDVPITLARALEAGWMQAQQELAALSINSRHIIATKSTHAIQECQPELVVDVIRELVGGV